MPFLRSEPGEEPVVLEALFQASVSRVYQAWTQPDQIIKWFGPKAGALVSADIDLRVGGRWRFMITSNREVQSFLEGEYLVIDPDKRLTFSWSHVREYVDGTRDATPESRVTVTFKRHGAATQVRLRHEGIADRDGRLGVCAGWEASFGHLRKVVEAA